MGFTGYATLCLPKALIQMDRLIPWIKRRTCRFSTVLFDRSPWGKQIHQYCGDAIEIIPTLGEYDLVFLDADNYLNYLELLLPKIKKADYCCLTMCCGVEKS